MGILIDENTKVLVQGITGRTGEFATRYMLEYGTKVVAGVTPGRGGADVWGVPVYNSVREAVEMHGPIDASVSIVPANSVKNAAMEAMENGIKLLLIPTERVPLHDTLEILAYAQRKNVRIIGPGAFGIINPNKAVLGWVGGSLELANEAFKPGNIGVISRSGGQTTSISWLISNAGFGVSTAIHVGSETVVGTTEAELLMLFENDDKTRAVVIFGEIGGIQEEEAAEIIINGRFTKPLIVYIAGQMLPSGIRFSHASAIIEGERGSAESKIRSLKEAGAYILDTPKDIVKMLRKIL